MSVLPLSPMLDLKDRVYAVTGASRGIGLSVCHALARRGAKVGMLARSEGELRNQALAIGDNALAVTANVASKEDAARAIDQVAQHFGGLDGLINNAGVARMAPLLDMAEAEFREMLDLNVLGVLFTVQAAAPHMRKRGGGAIINVSSASARHRDEFPYLAGYAASKAALERMTVEMRDELKHERIGVTLFSPGGTATTVSHGWAPEKFGAAMQQWVRQGESFDGVMMPELVGEAIVRCLEVPPGAAYDLVELRPNAPMPRMPGQT
jgi:NAD(P)-dependent dehydrogenase (short-subunit alcohol dehydrogenase family)